MHDPVEFVMDNAFKTPEPPKSELDRLARYLINNHGNIMRVDDITDKAVVDKAIRVIEILKGEKCSE